MSRKLEDLYNWGRIQLKKFDNPSLEAKILLSRAAELTDEEFFSYPGKEILPRQEELFRKFIEKRKKGEPLAYITGTKEFWSMPFHVSPGVLIPRPETETLVECVVEKAASPNPVIYEIGTGSGNVAAALAKELPDSRIIASDIRYGALQTAKKNIFSLGIDNVCFFQGNLFEPIRTGRKRKYLDDIVFNPPYLSEEDWEETDPGIRDFEPKTALAAGKSGLEILDRVIREAPAYLRNGGNLFLEIGFGQSGKVRRMFKDIWKEVGIKKDLAGIPRVIYASLKD